MMAMTLCGLGDGRRDAEGVIEAGKVRARQFLTPSTNRLPSTTFTAAKCVISLQFELRNHNTGNQQR
jgi:hypothetical protein